MDPASVSSIARLFDQAIMSKQGYTSLIADGRMIVDNRGNIISFRSGIKRWIATSHGHRAPRSGRTQCLRSPTGASQNTQRKDRFMSSPIPVDWPETVTVPTRALVATMLYLIQEGYAPSGVLKSPQFAVVVNAERAFDPMTTALDNACPGWE